MRILHVSAYFAPAFRYGGPPRSILSLCRSLQSLGTEVEVITTNANGAEELPVPTGREESFEGVPVRYLRRRFPRRFFAASGLRAALAAALRRCDVAHLHGLWNVPVSAAAAMAARRGVPYLVSPRGMLQPQALARGRLRKAVAFRLAARRHLGAAAALHATSDDEAVTLRGLGLGVPVFVAPNGVDLPPAPACGGGFASGAGLPADAPLIAFLGRVHPVKRVDLLIEAFARLRPRRPDARLVVAGPEELGHGDALRGRFAGRLGNVHWAGELDQEAKWRLLADASAAVMCSDSESFGLSAAEALAAGTPVVVTKTCPWEDVERARCGRWVEQEPAAIADALERLLADPAEARAMGARGRELIASRYGWEPIARTIEARYRDIAGRDAR